MVVEAEERVNITSSLLAILLSVCALVVVIWGARRRGVAPTLSIAWVIHILLWNTASLVLQLLLAEPVENSHGPLSRTQLTLLHTSALLIIGVIFLAYRQPYAKPITQFFDRVAPPASKLFWPTVIALALLVITELGQLSITGSSFAEIQAFSVTADAAALGQNALLASVMAIAVGYFLALLTLGRNNGVTRETLIMAWLGVLIFCGFSIAHGVRAVVLLPVAAGVITLSTLKGRARRRATTVLLIAGAVTTVVGAPVAAIMGFLRGRPSDISADLLLDTYNAVAGESTILEQAQLALTEVNRKFDAIGPGIELLAMEPPGTAGLQPLFSASLSPIPRVLFPTKPVPISRDGTYIGTPYRIAATPYGDPEIGMVVPVSASAIALWEFGSLGPLMFIVANILNLFFLNTVFLSRNVIARALGISMLGLPNAEFFFASPSMLLQNGLRLALFLTVLAVVALAWKMLAQSSRASSAPAGAA